MRQDPDVLFEPAMEAFRRRISSMMNGCDFLFFDWTAEVRVSVHLPFMLDEQLEVIFQSPVAESGLQVDSNFGDVF
jgi:hypothetical protein